ncbi:MAG: hypothetical protein FWE63_07825 [Bacteroidales bacterium]|nr:hypothetical protein [Bacteroidales bacterium]
MKKHETWRIVQTRFGHVQISNLHGKNEMVENIRIACFLANKLGYSIVLLARPEHLKTPDSKNVTLNIFQEYKVNKTPTKSAIDNMLRYASKQADHIILEIQSEISDGDLRRGIYERMLRTPNVKTLCIIKHDIITRYEREQILDKDWKL